MNKIPDAISPEELQFISETAPAGITSMDAQDLIKEATDTIKELERIVKRLDACQSTSINQSRWMRFLAGRRAIKAALRNMRKAIAV